MLFRSPSDRVALLDEIGFDWEAPPGPSSKVKPGRKRPAASTHGGSAAVVESTNKYSRNWNEMYQRLVEYKKDHRGDTRVPHRYKQDPTLGRWVTNQRGKYRTNKLSPEHAWLLSLIGFEWEIRQNLRTNLSPSESKNSNGGRLVIKPQNIDTGSTHAADGFADPNNPSVGDLVIHTEAVAQFHDAATHLHDLAHSIHIARSNEAAADTVVNNIEKGCGTNRRRMFKMLRSVCVVPEEGKINLKLMSTEILHAHSKYFHHMDSNGKTSSMNIFRNTFYKQVSNALF